MMWQIIIASSRLPNVDSFQFAVSLSGERLVQGDDSGTQWYTLKRAVCVECAIFGGLSKCIQAEWAAVSFRGGTFPAERKETSV